MNQYLKDLNPDQLLAVTSFGNPLVVCAGAGSGKTRVITCKIAYLIKEKGLDPESILAVTFTNKAANEMKERIKTLLDSFRLPFVATFHGFALRILKTCPLVDYSSWTILNDDDQLKLMQNIFKTRNIESTTINPKKALSYIGKVANQLWEKQEYNSANMIYEQIRKAYTEEKTKSHLLDFDDILIIFNKLLNNPDFLFYLRSKFSYILVDEYQDTNLIQHEIIKKLALDKQGNCVIQGICVVGDEDQSIYSWRGAQVSNMIDFEKDFKGTITISIVQNYRSVLPILKIANSVIKHNSFRKKKELMPIKQANKRVFSLTCSSDIQEAEALVEVLKIIKNKHETFDIAILYRAHYQSRLFEEYFIKHGMCYEIIGGIQFYDRLEIKDLIAYIRLVVNPFDVAAFLRIYNTPIRGLGNAFEELFQRFYFNYEDHNVLSILNLMVDDVDTPTRMKPGLNELVVILNNLFALKEDVLGLVDYLINKIKYLDHIKKISENDKEFQDRYDNIKELRNALAFKSLNEQIDVRTFLEEVALLQDIKKKDTQKNSIKMMSIHASKGLEFDIVCLVGLEENLFPSARSIASNTDLEEERRLMYVAITRAKEYLFCFSAKSRYTYAGVQRQIESRFLSEFSDQDYIKINLENRPSYMLHNMIKELI